MTAWPQEDREPSSCGRCSIPARYHYYRNSHAFGQPTGHQILARMLIRRAVKVGGLPIYLAKVYASFQVYGLVWTPGPGELRDLTPCSTLMVHKKQRTQRRLP